MSTLFPRVPRGLCDAANLTREQRYFIKTVVLRGVNVLLCAAAGTGKSTCIQVLRRYAELNHVRSAWTASTGVASCALRGTSIYSWAGLGRPNNTPSGLSAYLAHITQPNSAAGNRLRNTHLLVVDEVSMLPPFVLEWVDKAARAVREEQHTPFGGLQVVLVGDFLQLQPVHAAGSGTQDDMPPLYASSILGEACVVPCVLTKLLRQDEGDALTHMLQYVRYGESLPDALRSALLERVTQPHDVPSDATWIVSTRAAAHSVCSTHAWTHHTRLERARGKRVALTLLHPTVYSTTCGTAHAHDKGASAVVCASKASCSVTLVLPGTPITPSVQDVSSEPVTARRTLQDAPQAWERGVSAVSFARTVCDGLQGHVFSGMRVVVLVNVHIDGRIVCANGQRGVWIGIKKNCAQIRMADTDQVVDVPPTVRHWTNPSAPNQKLHAAWWPILPAYALTVHRVQGSTLQKIAVELSADMFAPQQAYVALSRARRLSDVYILPNVDLSCLQLCDAGAVRWYALLAELVQRREDTCAANHRYKSKKRRRGDA